MMASQVSSQDPRMVILVNTSASLMSITCPLTFEEHGAFVNDEYAALSYAETAISDMIQTRQLPEEAKFHKLEISPAEPITVYEKPAVPTRPAKPDKPDKSFKWDSNSTNCMLNLRFARKEEFIRPSTKKMKIWEKIADEMVKKGYNVTGPVCDSKYRNMLHSYSTIKNRLNKTGEGTQETLVEDDESGEVSFTRKKSTNWEFYDLMDANLFDKASVCPSDRDILGSTFNARQPLATFNENRCNRSAHNLMEDEEDADEPSDEVDLENQGQKPGKRQKQKMSIQEFLFQKNQREIQIENEKLKIQRKRAELEERRLELEARRIEAMNNVAAAMNRQHAPQPLARSSTSSAIDNDFSA